MQENGYTTLTQTQAKNFEREMKTYIHAGLDCLQQWGSKYDKDAYYTKAAVVSKKMEKARYIYYGNPSFDAWLSIFENEVVQYERKCSMTTLTPPRIVYL
jgi:hypothetical protein